MLLRETPRHHPFAPGLRGGTRDNTSGATGDFSANGIRIFRLAQAKAEASASFDGTVDSSEISVRLHLRTPYRYQDRSKGVPDRKADAGQPGEEPRWSMLVDPPSTRFYRG